MNVIKRILDLVISKDADPLYNRHIRFTNAVFLIVCLFAIQNTGLAFYHHEPLMAIIFIVHALLLTPMLVFNYQKRRVLASDWFRGVAITPISHRLLPLNHSTASCGETP
jgi:hypothetical protein